MIFCPLAPLSIRSCRVMARSRQHQAQGEFGYAWVSTPSVRYNPDVQVGGRFMVTLSQPARTREIT